MDGGGRRREARTRLEDWLLFVDRAGHRFAAGKCGPSESCRPMTNPNGMPKSVIEGTAGRGSMDKVVYTSKSTIERKRGPLRIAHLPGEAQPVSYSVHGAIAEHYKVDPAKLSESHAATIDYVISATAG
jgi:hypothetical protein